jgi:hypothetical protein
MTKARVVCPNCSDGPLFVVSEGRRVHVKCGAPVCQAAEEERIAARVMRELMRHLPPEITKGAKR